MPVQPAQFTANFFVRYRDAEAATDNTMNTMATEPVSFMGSTETELQLFEKEQAQVAQIRGQYRQLIDTFKEFVDQHGDALERQRTNNYLEELYTHLLEPQIPRDRIRLYGQIKRNLDDLCQLLRNSQFNPQLLLGKIKELSLQRQECLMGVEEKTSNTLRDLRLGQQGLMAQLQLMKEQLFEEKSLTYIQQHFASHPHFFPGVEVHIVTQFKHACGSELGLAPSRDTWNVHWLTEADIDHFKNWIKTELTPTTLAAGLASQLQSECVSHFHSAIGQKFTLSAMEYKAVLNELQQRFGTGWEPHDILEFIDCEAASALGQSADDRYTYKIRQNCTPLTISLLQDLDQHVLLSPGFKPEVLSQCVDPNNPGGKLPHIVGYDSLFW
ncbi:MAG: hypothetical protein ACRC5A_16785, partial [Enterobacteriaceae bacterium]